MVRPVTINDVAKRAGVTKSTVSRALSGNYTISEKTTARIRQIAQELGYTASSNALALATGKSNTLAIVITEEIDLFFSDPLFMSLLRGISDAIADTQYLPCLFQVASAKEQSKALRHLKTQAIDGVIHLSPWGNTALLDEILHYNLPTVLCGQYPAAHYQTNCSAIYSSDIRGSQMAAEFAWEKGKRQPVVIMGPRQQPAAQDRLAGYRAVYGATISENNLVWGGWEEIDGKTGLETLLRRGATPDVVLAGSDRIALGVLQTLKSLDYRVPQEIGVVGYDGLPQLLNASNPLAAQGQWQLTTIAQPVHKQGFQAVKMIDQLINGGMPEEKILPCKLLAGNTL